jgi:hypothetical protein
MPAQKLMNPIPGPLPILIIALILVFPALAAEDPRPSDANALPGSKKAAPPKADISAPDQESAEPVARRLPIPPGTPRPERHRITAAIDRFASQYRLDLDLVHAVIMAESAYDAHAVSPAGAVGLMQVMPETGADYGVTSVEALFDHETNLETGMRHLRRLLDKYDSIGHAVMAYNAGEGALERHGGIVTYPETQQYTHRVLLSYLRKKGIPPHSAAARTLVGLEITPGMAGPSGRPGIGRTGWLGQSEIGEGRDADTTPAPMTRLTSRLSPALSRRGEAVTPGLGPRQTSPRTLQGSQVRLAGDSN